MSSFKQFGLDTRLQQALSHLGYEQPTLVQEKAIPLALQEKKDIVARAKTGSGKTGGYVIPILQSILEESSDAVGNRALILVPSRELADQVQKVVTQMAMYCDKVAKSVNVAQQISEQVQASLLAEAPQVIVATPARALDHLKRGNIDASALRYLVIDEADLVLSFGYEDDLSELSQILPVRKTLQTWLMSATLSDEIDEMKKTFCRNTAVLKLEHDEQESNDSNLVQYYAKTSELDKFLLAYVIFKLGLIKGKTIVFVNNVDRCYQLKLFLEQFGIKACTLNAELPIASRLHIVEQFNKNVYNLVIATDESTQLDDDDQEQQDEQQTQQEQEPTKDEKQGSKSSSKKSSKRSKRKDKEYGVSRGVDFQNVSCVVNFDLPTSSRAYTHRVGRTARARKSGMALSFVVPKEEWGKHRHSSLDTAKRDDKVLARVIKSQSKQGHELSPYQFDMKQVESFRYRMEDAFRAVTKVAIREARDKEFRNELLTSEKLTRHFQENPQDLAGLRHDKTLHPTRVQTHLKRVPEYLLPNKSGSASKKDMGFVGFKKQGNENKIRKVRNVKSGRGAKKSKDPLKSFKAGAKKR